MIGKTLGPYRIESELGSGGMGKVYLADKDGQRFALKVVHPHLLESPGVFKRFLREAEVGKAVSHPNVARCYDCDQLVVDGTTHAFLVMEYVEGQTLRELLSELGTVPEELCRHIGREISKGLAAIHEAGVVHRDLKPENVLITPDHEVKVMDLGVARVVDEALRLSQTGAFVGSIHYAAPEQIRSADVDGRADLHALGVVLYELSSGHHPYLADEVSGVLDRVLNHEPRRLGELNPQLSAFFEEVTHTLLAKDRGERFGSAADFLRTLVDGEESTWWQGRAPSLRAETRQPLRRIRIPRETTVYGRDAELDRLRALYREAAAGEGRVVLIDGEAGIGKTRLVDEFVGRLHQEGEELNFLFGSYPPGGAATAAGAWSTAYREQFGAEGLEETLPAYLESTPTLVPSFAALLRGEPTPEGTEPLTKDSIQTVFVHATRALAAERTTVVLIEDLHFAPEEGRAMFAALALAVPEHRILLVGTARPGVPEKWRANLERMESASRMELSRLGPKDLVQLLVNAFHSERLAEELGIRIAAKSDGNPFFVFEIIRGLREGRLISKRPDGTWVSTNVIADIEVPSSVQDLIGARIAELDEDEQELLDIAACCGFEFDPGLVAEALGLGRIPCLRRFGRLEKVHRIVRSAGRNFVFDHHQVQEAVYADISEQLREEYHAALGGALEERHPEPDGSQAVEICEHLLRGRRGESALRNLDAAIDHLERNYLSERAIDLAKAALEAPDLLTGLPRMELLLRQSKFHSLLGSGDEERATLDEATALAEASEDPLARARTLNSMGRCFAAYSSPEVAIDAARRAIEIAREIGDETQEARALTTMGTVALNLARLEEAKAHCERCILLYDKLGMRREAGRAAGNLGVVFLRLGLYEEAGAQFETTLAISRELGDRQGEAVTMGNLAAVLLNRGQHQEALGMLRECIALCRQIGDRRAEARGLSQLGAHSWKQGSAEEAFEYFERSLALSKEIGDRTGVANATGGLGIALYILGRVEEARARFEEQISLCREIGDPHGEAAATGNLGNVFSLLGRHQRAMEVHQRNYELIRDLGDRRGEAIADGNVGLSALMLGRLEAALSHYERYLALALDLEFREGEEQARVGLAEIRAVLGDLAGAQEQHEATLALSRRSGDRTAEGYALHGLAGISGRTGDRNEAIRLYGQAESVRRESSYQKGLAQTLVNLGGLLADAGREREARERLEEAMRLGRDLGMAGPVVLGSCHLARLGGSDPEAALEAFGQHEVRLDRATAMEARFLLWRVTKDPKHLEEAHVILRNLRDGAPEKYREGMIANVPLHREIMAAWEEVQAGG